MCLRVAALGAVWVLGAFGQQSLVYIETVAGKARFDNRPAMETPLIQPQAVWVHPNGDVYIADGNFLIRKISAGQSTIVAGGGSVIDDSVPVPAGNANLDYPTGIVGTPAGELYISDVRHHRVRRLNPDGTIVTVAGNGTRGNSGDGGRATFAELDTPTALALSSTGQLYIADSGNSQIRRYDTRTGLIYRYAGTGQDGYSGDNGPALMAKIGYIRGLALDNSGNLFLADINNYVVRKITPDGTITTVAGNGEEGVSGDGGPGTQASIGLSYGLATDGAGNLYIPDINQHRVRMLKPDGTISTYAGQDSKPNPLTDNIPATEEYLLGPGGLAVDGAGNLFIAEADGDLIRRVDVKTRIITTVAGTTNPYDGIRGDAAPFSRPTDVASDSKGNIYIADNGHYRVRRIDRATGIISTVAGDGRRSTWEGATGKSVGGALSISVDPLDRLLIADADRQVVERINFANGTTETILDLSDYESQPSAAIGDAAGNVFIADRHDHQIYHCRGDGRCFIFAGIEGEPGLSGDGGRATAAHLNGPEGMVLDRNSGLIFCDKDNHVVRRIDFSTNIITRFAGDGDDDTSGDGQQAVQASLEAPIAITTNGNGLFFIADAESNLIRMVSPDGIIRSLTGQGAGFAGDGGPAVLAVMDTPLGLTYYDGALYVCDSINYRIRRLYANQVSNQLTVDPGKFSFRATQGADAPTGQLLVLQSSIVGLTLNWSLSAPGFTGNWLYATELQGVTPGVIAISVDHKGLAPGQYNATIVASSPGARDVQIPVELTVDPPNVASAVKLSPQILNFTVPRDGSETQSIAISSPGTNALAWRIQMLTDSPWLTASATAGTTPATIAVSVNAAGLEAGSYTAAGYFTSDSGVTLFIATMVVSQPKASMLLDRDIMIFEAVEGSTTSPAQPLNIFNTGSADLNWELVVPQDVGWIRASTPKGTVPPGAIAVQTGISVDPSGLRAGTYNASLTLRADGALGSPQILGVRLRVRPGGTAARGIFDKNALVFRIAPGSGPVEQAVTLSSTGGTLGFSAAARTEDGTAWLSLNPSSGSVLSSSQSGTLRVQVNPAGLQENVYRGRLDFSFSDGSVQQVDVLLILRTGVTTAAMSGGKGRRGASCAATKQVMIAPTLPNSFGAAVGWPMPLRAQVFDDCGNTVSDSTVTALVSTANEPQALVNLRNGEYTGTWTPSATAGSITVSMRARHPVFAAADLKLSGKVSSDSVPEPILYSGGVVNAASRRNSALMAPGSLMSLEGANFPNSASDAMVLVNGSAAQVVSSAPDEIRIVAPKLDGQPRASVTVNVRGIPTTTEIVTVVPADPGLFALPDGTSVAAGDTLTLTATGLGEVDGDGNVKQGVTARIGDQDASVTSAALLADRPGVYQLKIAAPAGISGTVQLSIRQNGVTSNTIPVTVN